MLCVDEQICTCVRFLGGFHVGEEGMWVRTPQGSSVSGGEVVLVGGGKTKR